MLHLRLLSVVAACVAASLPGCAKDRDPSLPKTVPVSVLVKYQQQPVAGAIVSFVADGGSYSAAGMTDDAGVARLTTATEGDGAVPGKYQVAISKTSVETIQDPKDPSAPPLGRKETYGVPKKYGDAATSGLTANVSEGGKNEFPFDLTD